MPFTDKEANYIVDKYCCAQCYSNLVIHHAIGRMNVIVCARCGDIEDQKVGRVTKWWAEHRGQEAVLELREVEQNLADMFPEQQEKSESEIMEELGF